MAENRTVRVPVEGGELAVEVTGGGGAPVLAVHGVSSNCRLWNWLRAEAPELALVMPDLRGRAGSHRVAGTSSIRRHAEDLVRVLDALELEVVAVCGMSMGGFVAVELATRWPERVRGLVLVDGGLPMALPAGLTPEAVPAAFAPQLERVARRWDGVEDYLAYFCRANPLLDARDPLLRDCLEHDLEDGRVLLSREAVLADATDVFFGEHRWRELATPTEFVCAEWGAGKSTPPAYSAGALEGFRAEVPALGRPRRIAGADHAATIMTRAGAAVVGAALHDVLLRVR
ncbi:alpha/beta fold hydrolase [Amycolatopsis jiangsuensis]|uniref:Pimeloyl-ACP methyl ester carboxylesterase n=1 Tax=Amycolatopsis jiangsuensis TaxID=1181879 RepID=A0A840IQW9_9PSEU|nr:alpha/beta hydrolase [Amycolatopsis jiangsuensis]MBB4684223.1 pimeloyl-ACP methyl ester carboxylesterase [Amycolatopsis jiangsuensis]